MVCQTVPRKESGFTLWLTGLSGSGKSTLARIVGLEAGARGRKVEILDADEVREHLFPESGLIRQERYNQIKRVAYLAKLLSRNGVLVISAVPSPYREMREYVRAQHSGNFIEVFLKAPLETCMARDVRGHYQKALTGGIRWFTGITEPYEEPLDPELIVETHRATPEESARRIIRKLEALGYL
ncbi:adenylyl-sulfate kinase [Heliobacterium gestii]|uniref:Adenylyl-sulfate kinase n=1 Tax=Heliomicrobium gestii TaxID=2699 RepID=A0A845LBA0_HELGE|nr:adenylyl-sulfate kinase [Heliomicrobium gestii]MBM7866099.1 adenylyl-sulfate kinase [Heliomicrobium gestii]MZP42574.1 adenylyl-sulfate kinase [Heliomicrobium gestii]